MVECSSGNCTLNCTDDYSCRYSTVNCSPYGLCTVNCYSDPNRHTYRTCDRLKLICPAKGNCIFNFNGGISLGDYIAVTCEENSTCAIRCTSTDRRYTCWGSHITCPRYSGDCTVECSGPSACERSTIGCGPGRVSCSGQDSCKDTHFICPANNNCTINCDGQYSCQNARVTCPTGDYSCNILCTDPLSCPNLSITNTHNVNLLCCRGETACAGTSVVATSTDCPYIT